MPFTTETAAAAGRKGSAGRREAERRYKALRDAEDERRSERPPPQFRSIDALVSHAEKKQVFSQTASGKVEIIEVHPGVKKPGWLSHPKGGGLLLWCSCGNAALALEAMCSDGHLPQRMKWLDHSVSREPSSERRERREKRLPPLTADMRVCRKCCRWAARTHCTVCDEELVQRRPATATVAT
jgi:hypothetical protein